MNRYGNGFQCCCEELETADCETRQYGVGKSRLTLRGFHRLNRGGSMKNQMFALISLGLLLATASAYAQTGAMKASVPFNFIIGQTQLPAGGYVIQGLG